MANEPRYVLRNARHLAADYVRRTVREGDTVVDATMGNGHDTLFLCELVGETGHVYAFDVQPEAILRTDERLKAACVRERATLLNAGHETMAQHVKEAPSAIMFNFGWLRGAQHVVTTKVETSLAAADAAVRLIIPGGIVTLCIYPGHEEGTRELKALLSWAGSLPVRTFNVLHHCFSNAAPGTPQLILIQKNDPSPH